MTSLTLSFIFRSTFDIKHANTHTHTLVRNFKSFLLQLLFFVAQSAVCDTVFRLLAPGERKFFPEFDDYAIQENIMCN